MKPKCLILVAGITAALSCSAFGQQDENLGKLSFPTSCDPKVQAEFERGVAMIHSYWFLIARRTFDGVLRQDPTYAIAYWGIALDLLNNSLAVVPPRADAEAAWAALERAREIGAKTQRERDWIEALSECHPFGLRDLYAHWQRRPDGPHVQGARSVVPAPSADRTEQG